MSGDVRKSGPPLRTATSTTTMTRPTEMPPSLEPLPPDDPIFSRGVSFAFRSDLPPEDDEPDAEARAAEDTTHR